MSKLDDLIIKEGPVKTYIESNTKNSSYYNYTAEPVLQNEEVTGYKIHINFINDKTGKDEKILFALTDEKFDVQKVTSRKFNKDQNVLEPQDLEKVKARMREDLVVKYKNAKITEDQAKRYSELHEDMDKSKKQTQDEQKDILDEVRKQNKFQARFAEKMKKAAQSILNR